MGLNFKKFNKKAQSILEYILVYGTMLGLITLALNPYAKIPQTIKNALFMTTVDPACIDTLPDCQNLTNDCGPAPNGCGYCPCPNTGDTCSAGTCVAPAPCVPDYSCAATTCQGVLCPDHCGGSVLGTLGPDNSCAATTCNTTTCTDACGNVFPGSIAPDNSCQATTCNTTTCTDACGNVFPGSIAPDNSCQATTCNNTTCTDACGISYTGLIPQDPSCRATTCDDEQCTDSCGNVFTGTLAPDCGSRNCGPAPNGCGDPDECGTCTSPEVCNLSTGICGVPCTPDPTCADTTCVGDQCTDSCGVDHDGNLTVALDCQPNHCGTSPHGCGTCPPCGSGDYCFLSGTTSSVCLPCLTSNCNPATFVPTCISGTWETRCVLKSGFSGCPDVYRQETVIGCTGCECNWSGLGGPCTFTDCGACYQGDIWRRRSCDGCHYDGQELYTDSSCSTVGNQSHPCYAQGCASGCYDEPVWSACLACPSDQCNPATYPPCTCTLNPFGVWEGSICVLKSAPAPCPDRYMRQGVTCATPTSCF